AVQVADQLELTEVALVQITDVERRDVLRPQVAIALQRDRHAGHRRGRRQVEVGLGLRRLAEGGTDRRAQRLARARLEDQRQARRGQKSDQRVLVEARAGQRRDALADRPGVLREQREEVLLVRAVEIVPGDVVVAELGAEDQRVLAAQREG